MDVRPCAVRNEFAHGKETGFDSARTKTVLYHKSLDLSSAFLHDFLAKYKNHAKDARKSAPLSCKPTQDTRAEKAVP
jgi:hypothetical protein